MNYLQRIIDKRMKLDHNLNYISITNIHKLFGNKSNIKQEKKNYYIHIINDLITDKIEINFTSGINYQNEKFNKWFEYIYPLKDYDGEIVGYFYSFGKLSSHFANSTNYPTKHININQLSINDRNMKQFEMARYLIYKISKKSKKIDIITIMKELYDYEYRDTYMKIYEKSENSSSK